MSIDPTNLSDITYPPDFDIDAPNIRSGLVARRIEPDEEVEELEARIEQAIDILQTHFTKPQYVATKAFDAVERAIYALQGEPDGADE